jgi:predicted Zn-dependent peptidase
MPHMTSASIGLWVRVGSRYEPAQFNGLCHFIEHLLFKGTKKRSANEISQAVEGLGGHMNAFTSEEMTCFHAKAPSSHFERVLDVLMDMLLNSRLAAADIAKERDVIKEEIAMYLDEPQHHVQELLNEMLWPDQPLGRPITGTPQSLDAITRPALLDFLKQHYSARSALLTVAGKVTHRQVLRAVSKYSLRSPQGTVTGFSEVISNQQKHSIRLFSRKTEQTQLALGFRTCSRHDERRYAIRLLNTILGENMSSRLFQVIREESGLAYTIYSTPSFFEDAGDLVIYAGLDTDKLPRVLQLITAELRRLSRAKVSAKELRLARDYVIGQIDLGLENTENQMNWLGENLLGYGRVFQPGQIKRRLASVSSAAIRSAATDFFRPERLNLALVSPLKRTDRLTKFIQL